VFLRQYTVQHLNAHKMRDSGRNLAAVPEPIFCAAGAMTDDQLLALAQNGRAISEGLLSRFSVFHTHKELPIRDCGKPKYDWPAALIERLQRIHSDCLGDFIALPANAPEGTKAQHEFRASKRFDDSQELHDVFRVFSRELEAERGSFDERTEKKASSIRDRILSRTQKYAIIHAIGRGSNVVEARDAEFALAMCQWLWSTAKPVILNIKDPFREVCEAVVSWMRLKGVTHSYTASKLFHHGCSRAQEFAAETRGQGIDQVLRFLLQTGEIVTDMLPAPSSRGGNRRATVSYRINTEHNPKEVLGTDYKPPEERYAWIRARPDVAN
jgi:hypothetical protein